MSGSILSAKKNPHCPDVLREAAAHGGARRRPRIAGAGLHVDARRRAANDHVQDAVPRMQPACTGVRSIPEADTVAKIIDEMKLVRRSERENRVIDHDEEGSMEIKKREGYF